MDTPPSPGEHVATSDVAILMYHSIADHAGPAFADFVVPPATFARQMGALAEAGLPTMTMTALAAARRTGQPVPRGTTVITFDDGFQDFVDAALPVLQTHGLTATLYITTRFIGGQSRWLAPEGEADRRMLGWRDLAEVANAGIEVGAHTDTHPQLDLLTQRVLARELAVPKVALEDRLGRPVTSLAYPFGYANGTVRRMTEHLGYDNACIVSELVSDGNDSAFAVPRLTVTRDHTPEDLLALARYHSSRRDRVRADLRRRASRAMRSCGVKKPESGAYSRSLR